GRGGNRERVEGGRGNARRGSCPSTWFSRQNDQTGRFASRRPALEVAPGLLDGEPGLPEHRAEFLGRVRPHALAEGHRRAAAAHSDLLLDAACLRVPPGADPIFALVRGGALLGNEAGDGIVAAEGVAQEPSAALEHAFDLADDRRVVRLTEKISETR